MYFLHFWVNWPSCWNNCREHFGIIGLGFLLIGCHFCHLTNGIYCLGTEGKPLVIIFYYCIILYHIIQCLLAGTKEWLCGGVAAVI